MLSHILSKIPNILQFSFSLWGFTFVCFLLKKNLNKVGLCCICQTKWAILRRHLVLQVIFRVIFHQFPHVFPDKTIKQLYYFQNVKNGLSCWMWKDHRVTEVLLSYMWSNHNWPKQSTYVWHCVVSSSACCHCVVMGTTQVIDQ